ncbi:MAG: diguanylate cyclase domain-containing protein [Acidimicrobiales bacterium]
MAAQAPQPVALAHEAALDTAPGAQLLDDLHEIDLRDPAPVDAGAGEVVGVSAGAAVGASPSEGAGGVALKTDIDHGTELLLQTFTADLATSGSGIDFVYRSLDRLAGRLEVDDAVLVLEDDRLGRQAFRSGRMPIEGAWGRDAVRVGEPGLHLKGGSIDEGVASSIVNLCGLALRLDVAKHESLHDPLTGALNRRSFDEQLDTACKQSERYGWRFALVLIDLDHFKVLNDRLGHQAGDTILRAVGAELRSGLRAGDSAARVGGDEFALILPNADPSLLESLLLRLQRAVTAALPEGPVGLSAGMAMAPEDGTDAASLFGISDQRLYEAKSR